MGNLGPASSQKLLQMEENVVSGDLDSLLIFLL